MGQLRLSLSAVIPIRINGPRRKCHDRATTTYGSGLIHSRITMEPPCHLDPTPQSRDRARAQVCHDRLPKVLRQVSSIFIAQQGACRRIKVRSGNFEISTRPGNLYLGRWVVATPRNINCQVRLRLQNLIFRVGTRSKISLTRVGTGSKISPTHLNGTRHIFLYSFQGKDKRPARCWP